MAIPDKAITRGEQYLASMAGESVTLPDKPVTRTEKFLAKAAGQDVETPPPITREEKYLDVIAQGGGGGGDITLTTLNVSTNGTTNAPSGKAYNKVVASVPNSYAAGDEGKVVSSGSLVSQSAHAEVTSNGTIDTTTNNSVTVNVPNSYAAGDEGKVVSNGELVSQGSDTVTANDTYDTTLISSLTVNVAASGGGAQPIASGTYTGAGTVNVDFPVGKKMPKKDFVFHLYAPDGTVFAENADYKFAQFYADSLGAQYDLSADSDNCALTALVKYTVGDASLQGKANWYIAYVRSAAIYYQMQGNSAWNRVKRDSNGFYILMRNYNTAWYFPSGMTYNWELLYYGSDPTNDIVEVP